jgi:hypothetical protein
MQPVVEVIPRLKSENLQRSFRDQVVVHLRSFGE